METLLNFVNRFFDDVIETISLRIGNPVINVKLNDFLYPKNGLNQFGYQTRFARINGMYRQIGGEKPFFITSEDYQTLVFSTDENTFWLCSVSLENGANVKVALVRQNGSVVEATYHTIPEFTADMYYLQFRREFGMRVPNIAAVSPSSDAEDKKELPFSDFEVTVSEFSTYVKLFFREHGAEYIESSMNEMELKIVKTIMSELLDRTTEHLVRQIFSMTDPLVNVNLPPSGFPRLRAVRGQYARKSHDIYDLKWIEKQFKWLNDLHESTVNN